MTNFRLTGSYFLGSQLWALLYFLKENTSYSCQNPCEGNALTLFLFLPFYDKHVGIAKD